MILFSLQKLIKLHEALCIMVKKGYYMRIKKEGLYEYIDSE